jgi:uncharacterized protein YndB with AHSA1/START domain
MQEEFTMAKTFRRWAHRPLIFVTAYCLASILFSASGAQAQDRTIRKQVVVDASLKEVWEAFTTNQGAHTFFAPKTKINLTLGGSYEVYFHPENPHGTRGCEEECRIHSIVPMKSLAFTWGIEPEPGTQILRDAGLTTIVFLDFKELSAHKTLVHFTNVGWGQGPEWDKSYDFFTKAWDQVLGWLRIRFAKGPIDWSNPPEVTESFAIDK